MQKLARARFNSNRVRHLGNRNGALPAQQVAFLNVFDTEGTTETVIDTVAVMTKCMPILSISFAAASGVSIRKINPNAPMFT